jgi:hypothetical protein
VGFGVQCGLVGLWFGGVGLLLGMYMSIVLGSFWNGDDLGARGKLG